jgi:hypothetical protein
MDSRPSENIANKPVHLMPKVRAFKKLCNFDKVFHFLNLCGSFLHR